LGLEHSDPEEVYHTMFRTGRPARHVRPDERLEVFRSGPRTIRSAWWAVPAWLVKSPRPRGRRGV
jgi:hypothetical protein